MKKIISVTIKLRKLACLSFKLRTACLRDLVLYCINITQLTDNSAYNYQVNTHKIIRALHCKEINLLCKSVKTIQHNAAKSICTLYIRI